MARHKNHKKDVLGLMAANSFFSYLGMVQDLSCAPGNEMSILPHATWDDVALLWVETFGLDAN